MKIRLLLAVLFLVCSFIPLAIPQDHVYAGPANCYWVGDGGLWSNDDDHWATVSGGTPADGNLPGTTSNVYFDANSFTTGSQTVEVDNGKYIGIRGDIWLENITFTSVSDSFYLYAVCTVTTNSVALGGTGRLLVNAQSPTNAVTLGSALTCPKIDINWGTLTTGNYDITCGAFATVGASGKAINLGSSTVTCTSWDIETGGGECPVTQSGSTINVSGTGVFKGNAQSYGTVNLTGSAHTIYSSNAFSTLALPSGTTQTITFTDGTTQTASTFTLSGDASHLHTLKGSGSAGWYLAKSGYPEVTLEYISIQDSHVSPYGRWWVTNVTLVDEHPNRGWGYNSAPHYRVGGAR